MNTALEYTTPENRGKCGFCGKEEGGYAKQDANGEWQAACWNCVKPTGAPPAQAKRKTVGTQITEDDEMRTDGRVKCNTKGCRNYVKPPKTTCRTCALPAHVDGPGPVSEAFSPAGDAALAQSAALDQAAKPGDTYQDPVWGKVHVPTCEPIDMHKDAVQMEPTPVPGVVAPAKPIDTAAQVIIPGVPARSATAEAKRKAEISQPAYVEQFNKALAARTKKVCSAGHDLTDINNAHIGDLRRTGKITCDPCNRVAQAKLAANKAAKESVPA